MKPLIRITIVASDGSFPKMTLDFDSVQGIAPHTFKHRDMDGKTGVKTGTAIRFKNGNELIVTDDYETLEDQWIKLTHPCVMEDMKHKCEDWCGLPHDQKPG